MQIAEHTDEDMAAYRKMMGLPAEKKASGRPRGQRDAQTGGEQDQDSAGGQGQGAAGELTVEQARSALEAKTDDELIALSLEAGIEGSDRKAIIDKLLEKTEA